MTPRMTRLWLAKYVMVSDDDILLARLAGQMKVKPAKVAVARALARPVPGSFFNEARDTALIDLWRTDTVWREIKAALVAIPGEGSEVTRTQISGRARRLGVRRPEGVVMGGSHPNPEALELRRQIVVDWNAKMHRAEIAEKHGVTTGYVRTAVARIRSRGEPALSGEERR